MNDRFDRTVWAGVERRLAGVEAFIPDAPPWAQPADAADRHPVIGPGSAFGAEDATRRQARPRRALALVVIGALLALIAALVISGRPDPDPVDERFGPYGLYRGSDASASAALLPDGRVLIVSGAWEGIGTAVARADLWDRAIGTVPASPPITARVNPTVTLLLDGRVLVIGGFGGPFAYASTALASAEVWDPATGRFQPAGSMADPRVGHSATMLPDGRVLVIGGIGPAGTIASAELWHPETGQFSEAGSLRLGRSGHASVLLPNGQVLVAGGRNAEGAGVGDAELWSGPSTNRLTGAISFLDNPPDVTTTRLLDGRVLIAGVYLVPPGFKGVIVNSWPIAAPNEFAEMSRSREGHAATLLASGDVLITGGGPTGTSEASATAELWDAEAGAFREAASMPRAATRHAALLLLDGSVLIVLDVNGPEGFVDPFIYDPRVEP